MRSAFCSSLRTTRIIFFFEVQAHRRFRFAYSSTLEQHERPKQAKPDETRSEPHLSAKDSEDAKAQGPSRHERNKNVPAH